MIYDIPGDEFIYEGVTYRVGAEVVATEGSDYAGLNGFIREIRTEDDRETDNETPDIYCYFDPPCLPRDLEELEERFSKLYGKEMKADDITLDLVIMAPDMLLVLGSPRKTLDIFVLEEDWAANDDYGHSVLLFSNYYEAKAKLNVLLGEEFSLGCLNDWKDRSDYQVDTDDDSFEGWIDGEHSSSHYSISVKKLTVDLTNHIYGTLGREFIDLCRVEDFVEQIESWEEVGRLSDAVYKEMIADKSIPERIHSKLGKNDGYWEHYWESVSEVGHDVVREYTLKNTHSDGENAKNDAQGGV